MTDNDDRPIGVLDRTSATQPTVPYPVAPQRTAADDVARASASRRPLPRGWGSHEERQLVRWALVGYFLLATYAVVFVVLAALVWS